MEGNPPHRSPLVTAYLDGKPKIWASQLFATPFENQILLILILALLICNAARGLASRLAGGLALAAATVLNSLCNILGFNSINSLHF